MLNLFLYIIFNYSYYFLPVHVWTEKKYIIEKNNLNILYMLYVNYTFIYKLYVYI